MYRPGAMELVLIALAWLAAMAAVALWAAPWWIAAAWALAAAPAALAWRGRRSSSLVAALVLAAAIGGWRFAHWHDRDAPALAAWTGQEVTLEGVVVSEADPGETTARYRVDADRVAAPGGDARATDGGLLVTLDQYAEYEPGARVRVRGTLERPPTFDDFDYAAYLARQEIVATMYRPQVELVADAPRADPERVLAAMRGRLDRALQRALPEPEASLGAGIVLGRDGNISRPVYDDFRATGLAHVVAVSGSNVALVTSLVFLVLTRFVRRTVAVWPAVLVASGYVVLAGASPSVVRAGLMAAVMLGGMALGRPQGSLPALGAAAMLMTLVQPEAALDIGFQLSLAATAGLIVLGPWLRWSLHRLLARVRAEGYVPDLVVQVAALSAAATIATLPVTWVNFGQVSLIGPLVNIAVAPLFAAAFGLVALTAAAGSAWEPAGWVAGIAAYYPLSAITSLARVAAAIPGGSVSVPRAGGESAAVAYLALLAPGWLLYRRLPPASVPLPEPPHLGAVRAFALGGGAAALLVVAWRVSVAPIGGPGELRVDVLDVGQGDAILVTTPAGHTTLIDGGPSGIALARQLGAVLPHWQRRIGRTVLTHPQEDHIAGLPGILRRYDVGAETDTGATGAITAFGLYRARATGRAALHRGDTWTEDSVRFDVLWPPQDYHDANLNNTSLVLRVTYGRVVVLLTGDSEGPVHEALMRADDVGATVLKVPHHGSKTTPPAFLRAVAPQVALISVGAHNRFGHPAPETLAALAGATVARTDRDGRVTVHSDGQTVHVTTAR